MKIKLLEVFKTDEPVIDRWTFVTNEVNHWTGNYLMIATNDDGFWFSQCCEGQYEPGGDNSHLGQHPEVIGEALVNHVIGRLSDG